MPKLSPADEIVDSGPLNETIARLARQADRSKEVTLPTDLTGAEGDELLAELDTLDDYRDTPSDQREAKFPNRYRGKVSIVSRIKDYLDRNPDEIDRIVRALVKEGKLGSVVAIKELLDRIDGKVAERHKLDAELPVKIVFVPAEELLAERPVEPQSNKEENSE